MVLVNASDADIPDLMTWFRDARSTQEWGGWAFRYPFDDKTFREDIQLIELDSFVVRSESGELIAFGQVRNKFGRGHVARLAVAPKCRGRGLGRELVNSLCDKAIELFGCSENSLFVSKTNVAALRCYAGLGFREAPYPKDDGTEHKTLFMIREITSD
jgi:ribosomal protein S18 acetylase RimI-like enzyme